MLNFNDYIYLIDIIYVAFVVRQTLLPAYLVLTDTYRAVPA